LTPLATERLTLRPLHGGDAPFIRGLLNEPSFLRYIGDRGVRTLDDARTYIADGPVASYRANGFGLLLVTERATAAPLGICGLLRRPALDAPDLGFAFLPAHWGRGYAFEAARAVLDHSRAALGLGRIVAITSLDNAPSIRLLEKLGFTFERTLRLAADDEVRLFASAA
jgi:RimJ/RimL family protein N-acetyltransferase